MIKITMVDGEASTHEQFAEQFLHYGGKGYRYMYSVEDFDCNYVLTDNDLNLEYDDEELIEIAETLSEMKKNDVKIIKLSDGRHAQLIIE